MSSTLRRLAQTTAVVLSAAVIAPLTASLHAQMNVPQADSIIVVPAHIDSTAATLTTLATIEAPAAPVVRTGAPMTGLRSGVHTRETARGLQPTVAAASHASLGQARALMVVGAAALITGAIIGGDPGTIIMVGGAVIGLYGLYQYLQ